MQEQDPIWPGEQVPMVKSPVGILFLHNKGKIELKSVPTHISRTFQQRKHGHQPQIEISANLHQYPLLDVTDSRFKTKASSPNIFLTFVCTVKLLPGNSIT